MNKNNNPVLAVGFSILALVTLVVITVRGFGLESIPGQYEDKAEIALPILVFVGAVALFLSLAFIASAFAALNLADRTQALALPEGSVRSLIALILITIFAITGIFLYRQLRLETTYLSTGLTLEEKDSLVEAIPSDDLLSIVSEIDENSEVATYQVRRRVQANEASEDFAEQMLTTISTLVVAVAGFYFGTRAVAVAQGDTVSEEPVIYEITEPENGKIKRGTEHSLKILGKNFQIDPTVKLTKGSEEILCEKVESSSSSITCRLKVGENASTGDWNLVVVNKDGGKAQRDSVFEITK